MNSDVKSGLVEILGATDVLVGDGIGEDYAHDESLVQEPALPELVVRPTTTEQVSKILRLCNEHGVPVTARGSGTGLSGGCVAIKGGVLLSMERMKRIKEIDTENHVAVVEPGVTLAELEAEAQPKGLVYPILPGESSASIGGNVATNAGGMRAVKYGVTRNNVLGLEAVLANGEVIRTGGKFVKASTGLDLTQLLIGSEGQLAIVTEVTLKLVPFMPHRATLLLPFRTLEEVTAAVPAILAAGLCPLMLEYIDLVAMAALEQNTGLSLGIPQAVKDAALAYLVVVIEGRLAERVEQDVEAAGELAAELGAIDVYSLPKQAGSDLLHAREQVFWVTKKAGATDIIDIVVPRAQIPAYMAKVSAIGQQYQSLILGSGHAGDGNVHLGVFPANQEVRPRVLHALFDAGIGLGGAISAEHGIGSEKRDLFLELEDPTRLLLQRRIKEAFDPNGILNPGKTIG